MQNFKRSYSVILSLFFILFASIAYADSGANAELTQLLKNMRSMQADFIQTIQDKKGKAVQQNTGRMLLQRPSQFRWEIKTPNKQLIVTNGKRLWIYDPDLEQVTIRSLVKAAGETPAMLLTDENLSLGKEFEVRPIKSSSTLRWFLLIPKDKGAVLSSLRLGFTNQQVHQMLLHDHLGHTTKIEFKNIVLNTSIPSSKFNFKPPANVDVINETKR